MYTYTELYRVYHKVSREVLAYCLFCREQSMNLHLLSLEHHRKHQEDGLWNYWQRSGL